AAGEEHEHGLAGHDALKVVEHVVGPDVREDLADTGEEEDVELAVLDLGADRRRDVELRVQHPLEHLAKVVLVLVWFGLEDPLPDAALLEDLDGQVVEVDLAHGDAVLRRELALDALLSLRHREGRHGWVGVDEERDLVAQALHLKEALPAEDSEQVLLLLVDIGGI